jgi:predicted nucleic acid-binding protein
MRLLIDTNLLVDYFGGRQPFCKSWDKINAMQLAGAAELWASAESYTDVFYLLRKAVGSDRLQAMFLESLDFINVCSIDAGDVRVAAERSWPDFEDCLIDVCAEKVKADYIISRDEKGFVRSRTEVFSPDGFFSHLEEEKGIVIEVVDW